jgi:hypothetical protein
VTINTPADGSTFSVGDPISFSRTASDPEDVDVTASLVWTSNINGNIGSGGSFSKSDLAVGEHTITATATDSEGLTATDQVIITVQPTVTDIQPRQMQRGNTITVTINGSGFAAEASVTFENGNGPRPNASNISVATDGESLTATVTVKSGGPNRPRLWDVRVTNPDGSTAVLVGAFEVLP